jgi:AcrR family transcriptional regulator
MKTNSRAILAATRDVLLENGLKGLSMRKVAARTGISATAIYRHFQNKDELLARVVDEGFAILGKYFSQALQEPDPLKRLLLTGRSYLDFAFQESRYYQIIFLSGDALDLSKLPLAKHPEPGPTFQFLLDRIAECRQAGLLRADQDDFSIGLFLWAECHGLAALHLRWGGVSALPLKQYRALCDQVLKLAVESLQRP